MTCGLSAHAMRSRSKIIEEFALEVRLLCKNLLAAILDRVLPGVDVAARRRILFIEDRVPHPHLGAGYPRSNVILWDLTKLGYDVTLYPLIYPDESEENAYEDIPANVKVALGCGSAGLRQFLAERPGHFGLIFVSRPHNMAELRRVLPIKRRPRIIYDAEALFCMREIEQRRLEGRPLSVRVEQKMIGREVALAAASRCIVSVSEPERSRFVAAGFRRVFTLSHAVEQQATPAPFNQRTGFLFVGPLDGPGTPNGAAVIWFAREILPRIRKQLGEAVPFRVCGHYKDTVAAAVGDGVEFLGRVDNLAALYNEARAFVAPSLVAAGIPLKVIEAAAYGLPTVVTTLLANQLGWQSRVELLSGGTAEEFAAACVRVYTDEAVWNGLRLKALERVQRDHSPQRFLRKLENIVEEALS